LAPKWLLDAISKQTTKPDKPNGHTTQPARLALEAACGRVALAKEGGRNNALNAEAYQLAELVRRGALDRDIALDALGEAAERAGLGESEIEGTLRSAFGAGEAQAEEGAAVWGWVESKRAQKDVDFPIVRLGDIVDEGPPSFLIDQLW